MKKLLLYYLLSSVASSAYAQSVTVEGQIVDAGQKGIPFAAIQVKNKAQGIYTDETGIFKISVDQKDTLVISCIGFETKEWAAKEKNNLLIQLDKAPVALKEVAITYKKTRQRTGQLGYRSKYFGNSFLGPGFEEGLFFQPDKDKRDGYIKEVYFYIAKHGIPDTKFRVHIYSDDSVAQRPERELTDSNLIVQASPAGGEWVKVDVSGKRIPVRDGFYVTMEWVSGYGNNNTVQKYTGGKGHISKKGKQFNARQSPTVYFQGQVLGLVQNKHNLVSYHKTHFLSNTWGAYRGPLVPMIYASYIYYKQ